MLARPPGDRVRLTLGYRATLAWDALVARRPGLRLPGAFDGFEVAARELLGPDLLRRVRAAAPRGAVAAVERLRRRASLLRLRNVVEPQRMAEHPKLPRDLRRKVLQHLDELEPAVRIQAGS